MVDIFPQGVYNVCVIVGKYTQKCRYRKGAGKVKILIISHNALSTYNNMGKTLLSLFSAFPREQLCQLFVHPAPPNVDQCQSYWRITDKQVLKGVMTFSHPGSSLTADPAAPMPAAANEAKSRSLPLARLGRDALWKLSRWYSPALKTWLAEQKPTCIFLAPGYAKFIYDVALKISRDLHIPIVTYICDDYYFVKTPKGLLARYQHRLLQRKMDKTMAKTCHLVGICPEILAPYMEKFGLAGTEIMTGASFSAQRRPEHGGEGAVFSYFGNVGCNRYVNLALLGKTLDDINAATGLRHRLEIYTGEQRQEVVDAFAGIESVVMGGFISPDQVREKTLASDFLVHTEAFDAESVDRVKNSVSTKIADSLACGIPLVAYGPANVASMAHLIRYDCAFIATDPSQLRPMLDKALSDGHYFQQIVDNALATAKNCHDAHANSQKLMAILQKAGEGCE